MLELLRLCGEDLSSSMQMCGMGMRNIFFVVFFTLCTACYGEVHLTCEQSAVLHVFFQNLIKESEVGYVLFNEKPVCIQGFYTKDPFCVGFSSHIEATALKEGKCSPPPPSSGAEKIIEMQKLLLI